MAGDVPNSGQNEASATPAESEPSASRPSMPEAPLALYRRYRPSTFAEVKGQEHVTEPLRQALRSGRVHHAYLFSGPRGCGKTSSARILARSLNCEQGPTPDPCGTCASCVALAPSGPGSIDVIEIDAASHGGIDDARDLRERAFYSPVSARYKIYIIDEAHMVTGGGFNALLKLVEEPPPHLKFVFATTEPDKVIPTIRSRTHHYPFRLVPPAVLRELLEDILRSEQIPYEPSVLPVVIRAGAGSARDTLSVVDQLIAGSDASGLRYDRAIALLGYTDDALLDEVAEAFAAGDGAAVFRTIDRVVEAGHDPRRFAMDLLDRLRDLIVLAAVPDAGASGLLELPEDRLERMGAQAAGFGQARLVHAAETVSSGLVEMRGATSPRLLLELMCAQVLLPPPGPAAGLRQAPPARPGTAGSDDLLARVERLERWARTAAVPGATAPAATAPGAGAPSVSGAAAAADRPVAPSGPDQQPAADRPHEPSARSEPEPPRGGRPAGDHFPRDRQPGAPSADQERQPPPSRPAAAGHPLAAPGALDTASLLDRWPDVLDAVRQIRKTPWILLTSYASVESMEGTVLTLSFDTEGNAKGFGTSGSDNDLADAMEAMFGFRPAIRTIASPGGGRGARGRARGRGDGDPGPAPAHTGQYGEPDGHSAADADRGAEDPAGSTGSGGPARQPGPARQGGAAGPGGSVGSGGSAARGGSAAPSDLGGRGHPASVSGSGDAGPGDAGPGGSRRSGDGNPAGAGAARGGTASAPDDAPAPDQALAPDDVLAPDDAPAPDHAADPDRAVARSADRASGRSGRPGRSGDGGPAPAARAARRPAAVTDDPRFMTDDDAGFDGLVGSDLIARELGGKLIEEIGGG